jgi:hypothetical protein
MFQPIGMGPTSWLMDEEFQRLNAAEAMADYALAYVSEIAAESAKITNQKIHGYLDWLMRMVMQNSLALGGNIMQENIPSIVHDILIFDHQKRRARVTIDKDIYSYKTPLDLEIALSPLVKEFTATRSWAAVDEEYLNGVDAELIFTCPTLRVIQLKSKAAAIAYGSSRWCTAYTLAKNAFDVFKNDLLLL